MIARIDHESSLTVVFCADNSYAAHLGAALYSLLVNNVSLRLEVVVISTNISDSNQLRLERICKDFDVAVRFELVAESSVTGLPTRGHLTSSAYLRLLIPEIVSAGRCLYLDSDLIVRSSIAELTTVDLDDSFLAAVENPGFKRHKSLGMDPTAGYFNSGVMLINLEKWRETKVKESVYQFIVSNASSILFMDQCGLNSIVNGDWVDLPRKFNMQLSATGPAKEYLEHDPVIVHFTGSDKPWQLNYPGPYKGEYWFYRNRTGFRGVLADDFGFRTVLSRITPRRLKQTVKAIFPLVNG